MKTYLVTIEETVDEAFSVEAENEQEALRVAEENYINGQFILEPGYLTGVKFSVNKQASV